MKANDILNEDNWWMDKLKKGGQKVASKVSSQAQGALDARNRGTELMTAYKKALGSGLEPTAIEMGNWLKTSDPPTDTAMMRDAAKQSKVNLRANNPITISQARDYLVALAGAEARMGRGAGAGVRSGKGKPATAAAKDKIKSADQPLTVGNLGAALQALKGDDDRFI